MLSHFAAFADPFSGLITFNGKAFDLPLIQTRQLAQENGADRAARASRSADLRTQPLERALPLRRLSYLEEALLGFRRQDDIPGGEIPAVYFNYLRRGENRPSAKGVRAQSLRILSMAGCSAGLPLPSLLKNPAHPGRMLLFG